MKYLIIISILLSTAVGSYGQTNLLRGSTQLIFDGTANHIYNATITRTSKDRFNVEIQSSGRPAVVAPPTAAVRAETYTFTISPLRLNTFTDSFVYAINQLGGSFPTGITAVGNLTNIQMAASVLYKNIETQNESNPPAAVGPKAGDFYVNQEVSVFATTYVNSAMINGNCPVRTGAGVPTASSCTTSVVYTAVQANPFVRVTHNDFKVKKVEIVIHNGFMNRVRAVVEICGIDYVFNNPIPIGISSRRNIDSFNKYYLRCNDPIQRKVPGRGYVSYVVNLMDIVRYVPNLTRNVFDKSPRNATHTIVVKQNPTIHTVYKEPVSRLIQATVFSDFMGIEEDKPNGLIQTEIYRRINLRTIRNQLWGSKNVNWGMFQYLRPKVSISKVEDKERVLFLDYLTTNINGQERSHAYASSIDLHLYQYMKVGSLFNLALFQNPHLHTTVEFNTGFYFGLVPLKDTLRLNPIRLPENDEYTAVTFETFLETNIKFSMNKYLEFSMGYTPFILVGLGKYYTQVKDRDKFVNNVEQGGFWDRSFLGKAELLICVKPAPNKSDGRFFGRYRFIHQLSNPNLYYHQIQVGYSFYLDIKRPKS